MKAFLIATTLMFGSAAMAQDSGAQMPPANQPMGGQPMPGNAGPMNGDMPAPPPGGMPGPGPMTNDGAGAPGMSAMPSGMTARPGMGGQQGGMATADTSNYPRCSRTVTDKCMSGGSAMSKKMSTKSHMMKKKS